MLFLITFISIVMLIFVNGFTDAPNAITTIVSTKVWPFKKAAFISAIFNSIGIIVMCIINFSVANCISSIVNIKQGIEGMIVLFSSIISVVTFSVIASFLGIPTSETHGLIAGLTGSAIVIGNLSDINQKEWGNVIIGLIWSILGTFIIVKIIYALFSKKIYNIKDIKLLIRFQKIASCGLSFMHGAQDGQKFIGTIILYMYIICGKNIVRISYIENIWIIIFVMIIMFFGVSIGGEKIVKNIGSNMVKIDKKEGIISDLSTVLTLFVASFLGIPVSTTHVKISSLIALKNNNSNKESIQDVFKAWIWTFPSCFVLSFIIAKFLEKMYL